jgi:hypothetical protein
MVEKKIVYINGEAFTISEVNGKPKLKRTSKYL